MKKIPLFFLITVFSFAAVSCAKSAGVPSSAAGASGLPDSGQPVRVDYYCSEEGCLARLQEEISAWNQNTGKEKGVFINLISDINAYQADLELLMETGTHYALAENGENGAWYRKGWVLDLHACGNPEIEALLESYADGLTEGVNMRDGAVLCIPSSVSPLKLAVNRDLFDKSGLEYPETWTEAEECARIITENGAGTEFGFGWSSWTEAWPQYCFDLCSGTAGSRWDPGSGSYDFSVYREPAESILRMQQNRWILGADDLSHDAVCAQFAQGRIGMLPAGSYALFTERFPAKCRWELIDPPAVTSGQKTARGVFRICQGCGIDRIVYERSDAAGKKAIEEAWLFLNSDGLNRSLYESCGRLPWKESLRDPGGPEDAREPQWSRYTDLSGYLPLSPCPDTMLPLEGDPLHVVMENYLQGRISFAEASSDLNTRYNAALQILKEDGEYVPAP